MDCDVRVASAGWESRKGMGIDDGQDSRLIQFIIPRAAFHFDQLGFAVRIKAKSNAGCR